MAGEASRLHYRPQFYIPIARPRLTYFLLGVNLLVFLAMIAYGYWRYDTWTGTEDMRVLVDFGAKVNQLIARGETWRLFTAMFLHIGVLHLLFNLYALNALGPLVEGYFGHGRFAAIYLVGGLFGSLASYAFSLSPSAGASGAIFGLAGATTVYFFRYRENFGARGQAILQNMLLVIGINLIFGFTAAGIDNWGHIGGLVGGAIVAVGLLPRYRAPDVLAFGRQPLREEVRTTVYVVWVGIWVLVLVWGIQYVTQNIWPQFIR
jgi:rhomboid protease GluP